MKKSLKKVFILLLSVAMVFTLMAMPVYAEGSGENEGQDLSFDKEDSIKVYPKGTFGEDPGKMPETAFKRLNAAVTEEDIDVAVTDGLLSWSALEYAMTYYLYINDTYVRWLEEGESGAFDIDRYIDISIKKGRIEKADDGVYVIKVEAEDSECEIIGSGALTYNYETDAVYEGEITVNAWIEDGILYWDPIEDAEYYEFMVEGEEYDYGTRFDEESDPVDPNDLIDDLIRSGEIEKPEDNNYSVAFVAYDEFDESLGSKAFTYHYESAAEYVEPAEITLTVNSGMLSWTEVEDTDYYVLDINDDWGNEISRYENGSLDIESFIDRGIQAGWIEKAEDDMYEIEILAYDSNSDIIGVGTLDYHYESDAEYREPVEMTLSAKDGLLSWTEVEGANEYRIYINEEDTRYLYSDENGSYNINLAIDDAIKSGRIEKAADNLYELEIEALDYYDAVLGEGWLNYHYESAAEYIEPEDIKARIENGKIYWEAIDGVVGYNCFLDGKPCDMDGLSADLENMADIFYTRGLIDNSGEYSVSIMAFNEDGYLSGSWDGTFEYVPKTVEIKQIKEIEVSDINTDIREGKKVKFTAKVAGENLKIAEEYWQSSDGMTSLSEYSDALPTKGVVFHHFLVISSDWGSSFADEDKVTVKYNGKTVKVNMAKYSDRYIALYGLVPPVFVGEDSLRIDRNAGSDRYETAFKAADKLKKQLGVTKFENIVIASGTNFPDALAGAYLAKVKNAPILLTRKQNAAAVADYVKKNMEAGGTVYILGGTGAVPTDMEAALKTQGITKTKRLQGANRYETNIAILTEAGVKGQDLLVCAGGGYADSLSASATGRPVLLVGGSLLPNQQKYLESIKSEISGNVYAIGGTGAVSEAVFKEVCAYAKGEKARVAGDTRYTTSKAVAEKFFPRVHDTVVLAYAQNYPDGLAGGPVAYAMNSPLLLVVSNKTAAAKEYASAHGSVKCLILGGPTLISDAAALAIVK